MSLDVEIQHRFENFTLDIGFSSGPGITALFGRSGSGKSSVIKSISGLLKSDQSRIEMQGILLEDSQRGIHLPAHQRRLGTVFQDARLFPHLTVRQNLTFGARYAPRDAKGAEFDTVVQLLGLEQLLDRAPRGLSGGEQQRTALGRALLAKPRMLLMDEPLAALDAPRKQEILPYLEALRDGPLQLPILYVSHSMDEVARLADTLVLLRDGRVTAQGSLFDVLADPEAVPLVGVRDAGAVVNAEVIDHAPDGLSRLKLSAGHIELPGVQAAPGSRVRLRILAQDIILSRYRPEGLSSRNILPVQISAVRTGEGPGAAISLNAGEDRLLARITIRALKELDFAPGDTCFAIFKATTVAPGHIGR